MGPTPPWNLSSETTITLAQSLTASSIAFQSIGFTVLKSITLASIPFSRRYSGCPQSHGKRDAVSDYDHILGCLIEYPGFTEWD